MNWVIVTAPMGRYFYLRVGHRYPDLYRADPAEAQRFAARRGAEDYLVWLQRRFPDDSQLRQRHTLVAPAPPLRYDGAADRGMALAALIVARLQR
jgi:hypothetical protein